MGRHSCCIKQKLRKGLWSPEEDEKLFNYITRFGVGCWSSVPKLAGIYNIILQYQLCMFFFDNSSISKNLNMFDACRIAKVWKELQIEMDKLLET
jgi:hypothetical protein